MNMSKMGILININIKWYNHLMHGLLLLHNIIVVNFEFFFIKVDSIGRKEQNSILKLTLKTQSTLFFEFISSSKILFQLAA